MKRTRKKTAASRVLGPVALLGTSLVACGARSGLPVPDLDSVLPADATTCKGVELPVYPHVPNLYFVLDVSGSMLQNAKWQNVRSSVAELIGDLGARARFGAAVFPEPLGASCAPGVERMPLQLGDDQGTAMRTFLADMALTPRAGRRRPARFARSRPGSRARSESPTRSWPPMADQTAARSPRVLSTSARRTSIASRTTTATRSAALAYCRTVARRTARGASTGTPPPRPSGSSSKRACRRT